MFEVGEDVHVMMTAQSSRRDRVKRSRGLRVEGGAKGLKMLVSIQGDRVGRSLMDCLDITASWKYKKVVR